MVFLAMRTLNSMKVEVWEEGNKERVTQECIETRKTSVAYFLSCEEYGCERETERQSGGSSGKILVIQGAWQK